MASRSARPLHPTNLHVNQSLSPNDTVQSRLPDPSWLERWLSQQIDFDEGCEAEVAAGILRNLPSLFEPPFETVADLTRDHKRFATFAQGRRVQSLGRAQNCHLTAPRWAAAGPRRKNTATAAHSRVRHASPSADGPPVAFSSTSRISSGGAFLLSIATTGHSF